jgi:hypothetical protein
MAVMFGFLCEPLFAIIDHRSSKKSRGNVVTTRLHPLSPFLPV